MNISLHDGHDREFRRAQFAHDVALQAASRRLGRGARHHIGGAVLGRLDLGGLVGGDGDRLLARPGAVGRRVVEERVGVEVEVVEDMLVLSGEKRVESESKEQGCYRVERTFGHFQRAIPLPSGIDLERAESKFDNGVLTVRIPKAPEQATANRRLEIK